MQCSKTTSTVQDPKPGDGYIQFSTPFDNVKETRNLIIYEINLRAFSESGDIQGIIDRFDEIKKLNVNTIWLMPIFEIGEVKSINSPYSVKNFKKIDDEFGTLDDLRNLTELAHQNDIAVILDWVANHTSWDNEWINNTGWYTTNQEGYIVHPPGTNWTDVADLNFDNYDMRFAMIDAMLYWALEANIDGFRCDYADGVPFDFWQSAIQHIKSLENRKFIFLAEGTRSDHLKAGFSLLYGWEFYHQLKQVYSNQGAHTLFETHNNEYENVLINRHILRFTTNHDESAWDASPVVLFKGNSGALTASAITIFMGGVPLIYSGQEVGRETNTPFFSSSPIDWTMNNELLQSYQKLLQLYSNKNISKADNLTDFSNYDVVCFKKSNATDTLLFLANIRNRALSFSLNEEFKNTNWINLYLNEIVSLKQTVELAPFEFLILTKD